MKFEEYLESNRDKILHESPKDEMWEAINTANTRPPKVRSIHLWMKVACVLIIAGPMLLLFTIPRTNKSSELSTPTKIKIQMAALANGEKTSQRILAVNMVDEVKVADEEIIQILIERMQLDESKNVQLAAVRVLSKYINNETVRIAMLEELEAGNDPYIQMKVIEALSTYKENQGSQRWDALLESKTKENSLFENRTTEL